MSHDKCRFIKEQEAQLKTYHSVLALTSLLTCTYVHHIISSLQSLKSSALVHFILNHKIFPSKAVLCKIDEQKLQNLLLGFLRGPFAL